MRDSVREQMRDAVRKQVMLTTAFRLIEQLWGQSRPTLKTKSRTVGEFEIYRQLMPNAVISYAVTIGHGGVVVLYGDRRPSEDAPHKLHSGNYMDERLPDLIEALKRALVLEKLAEIK